jgi:hypothetical protein
MKKHLFALVAMLAFGLILIGCQLNSVDEYSIEVSPVSHGKVVVSSAKALAGTGINLTLTPDSGYALAGVKINGTAATAAVNHATNVGTYAFDMPAQNTKIEATFTTAYKINGLSVAGGTVTADYAEAAAGTSITVAVTPAAGFGLVVGSLKANNEAVTVTPGASGGNVSFAYSFTMPDKAVTLGGSFAAQASYAIGMGAVTDPSSSASFAFPAAANANEIVQVDVYIPDGYSLTSLKANGVDVGKVGSDYYFVMPAANVTVTATVDLSTTAYTLTSSVTGVGAIAFCLDEARTLYLNGNAPFGTRIYVKNVPGEGYTLSSLKVAGVDIFVTGFFSMPAANTTVTAVFTKDATSYTIAAPSATPNGTIARAAGVTSATYGTIVNLTVTPASGYRIKKNTIRYTTASGTFTVLHSAGVPSVAFSMPAENITAITGTFEQANGIDLDTATNLWAPIWGGSGSWDPGSLTAVFGGAWVSIGWPWTGTTRYDFSEYDRIVFTLAAPTAAKLSAHVQYDNGTAQTDVEVPAGSTTLTLNLDAAGKASIPQIWIQSEIAATIQFTSIKLF